MQEKEHSATLFWRKMNLYDDEEEEEGGFTEDGSDHYYWDRDDWESWPTFMDDCLKVCLMSY
jgi:hypothetical protein